MTEKLKKCPFCGGEAKIDICKDGSGGIYCSKCDFTPLLQAHFNSQNDRQAAIDWWNTRAEDENPALTLDELREMKGEPVWTIDFGIDAGTWEIVGEYTEDAEAIDTIRLCNLNDGCYDVNANLYGKTWLAYRKPEGEAKK